MRREVAPYGSWGSPISAEIASAGGVRLDAPSADGQDRYWLEGRASEAGRVVLVRRRGGIVADVIPPPLSVRSRVHEYGGGAYLAAGGIVWFSNSSDQRIWRVDPGNDPRPLTAAAPGPAPVRYADARLSRDGDWLVCVRETHGGASSAEVLNELVAVQAESGEQVTLSGGRDFYSFPRLSPDGSSLAWTCWDHPAMPWDATELWVGSVGFGGGGPSLADLRRVAGGPGESIFQPEWGPDGALWYVSDAEGGWWNLWRHDPVGGESLQVTTMEAEWGRPQWVFGDSTYAFVADGTLVGTWAAHGADHLGSLDPTSGRLREAALGFSSISHVRPAGDGIVLIGASPSRAAEVVEITYGRDGEPFPVVLARSRDVEADPTRLSVPEPVEFPTSGGLNAHALYYPPTNPDFCGPDGERAPLLVMSHGGPTGAASSALDLSVQYWTSRGIAVIDVDYGGSTGYGRPYRERLERAWGIVDVDDCIGAAVHLVGRGDVDGERLAIRGASAGGYTALCALVFRDVFAVGASYYGVADAAALTSDAHKFEARYLDRLIGPWPGAAQVYRDRSPLFHLDQLDCPVILFQGDEDPVVPPSQAQAMVDALEARGVRHASVCFEGESHGFRRAETLRRCLVEELSFYGEVLGFEPAP